MAAIMLETPSRVWRRIEEIEDNDMPSLPSIPVFEDSAILSSSQVSHQQRSDSIHQSDESDPIHASDESLPYQSTPTAAFSHHTVSTLRPPSSASSPTRFAHSVATSHSSKSVSSQSQSRSGGSSSTRQFRPDSFEVSEIRPVGRDSSSSDGEYDGAISMELAHSRESVPKGHLTPAPLLSEEELDLTDALEDISRSNSPFQANELNNDLSSTNTGKYYDYTASLRSEPKPSRFGTNASEFANVSFRKPVDRTRTPSLTRTSSSFGSSTSTNSIPFSTRSGVLERPRTTSPLPGVSVPLPRSVTASPSTTPRPSSAPPVAYTGNDSISDDLRSSDGLPGSDFSETHSLHHHEVSTIPEVREDDLDSAGEDAYPSKSMDEPHSSDEEDAGVELGSPDEALYANGGRTMRSPTPLSTAFSSPAPSAILTPTPAFPSRPRPRFQMSNPQLAHGGYSAVNRESSPGQDDRTQAHDGHVSFDYEEDPAEEQDPATPHAYKRSFLMDVINSTARPRMKFPTPHPNRFGINIADSNQSTSSTPASSASAGNKLNTVFAGITPRPRATAVVKPRYSHPLAQAWTAESESDHDPQSDSPYDPATERASFLSTASSHDLTNHVRANASFDPVMGLGAQGTGVGRFNAGKLNTYLHGLNRRLQEENEALVERIKKMEDDRKSTPTLGSDISSATGSAVRATRLSGGRRGRVSMSPGLGLGDVEEADEETEWMEEKAQLESLIQGLKDELQKFNEEKEDIEGILGAERAERTRDKERWRERMGEVERGVEGIVRDLESKLEDAETRARAADETLQRLENVEQEVTIITAERDAALQRAENAERALASEQDLGSELNAANERISNLTGDLKSANSRVHQVERKLVDANEKANRLEKELKEENEVVEGLDQELQARLDELDLARKQVEALNVEVNSREDELQETKAYVSELEDDAGAAVDRIESLQEQLDSARARLQEAVAEVREIRERADKLEGEAERGNELARQMEEALEAAEKKMVADEEEVAELKGTIVAMKREMAREQTRSISRIADPTSVDIAPDADVEALENELDDAHKEIARLKILLNQSPARKAVEKAKDSRLEMLEKERDDLLERIRSMKGPTIGTPNKFATNNSGISPFHRQILSLMSPKTPGGPLRDMSWLNATMNDPSISPLVSEIARLQRELDRANESIDEKLEQLEDAGFGVVSLTRQLEDGKNRIGNLEDEIARLSRKDDRRTRRLQKTRCLKCRTKVDFRNIDADESLIDSSNVSLSSDPPTPPTKTSEALRSNLQSVNRQLAEMKNQWDVEKRQLLGEKAVLQDAAYKLNLQVRNAQAEATRIAETERAGQKARASVEGELEMARQAVIGLEAELKDERTRLRKLTTEQGRFERQKNNVLLQLQRTESDMEDVKENLHRVKRENLKLEAELRSNATVEQKAKHLERRVVENASSIDQLRQERSLLVRNHKDLQKKYSEVTSHMDTIRNKYKTSQAQHDNRRHELDMHLLEIEDLRNALTERENELERAEAEKARVSLEKTGFMKTVRALEADLLRVRKDAERFGDDLKALKKERDKLEEKRTLEKERAEKAERGEKQLKARMKIISEELAGDKEKGRRMLEQWQTHICAADEDVLFGLKMQHKQECKGLIVQIKYLKAKFTRESCLRYDLGYQKKYLLTLLSRCERTEHKVLAAIARIGFAGDSNRNAKSVSTRKKRTLKSVATSVRFLCRIKRASELWQEQVVNRQAVTEALHDVRRRRAAASMS